MALSRKIILNKDLGPAGQMYLNALYFDEHVSENTEFNIIKLI